MSIGNRGGGDSWVRILSTGTTRARKKFSQDVARLRTKKIIETKTESGNFMAKLAKKGFVEYLKLKLVDAEELPNNDVCIVVFDIPEKKRGLRKLFRGFLNSNYFFFTQKSVWVSRFDVSDILNELLVYFGLEQWVKIYIGKEIISSR